MGQTFTLEELGLDPSQEHDSQAIWEAVVKAKIEGADAAPLSSLQRVEAITDQINRELSLAKEAGRPSPGSPGGPTEVHLTVEQSAEFQREVNGRVGKPISTDLWNRSGVSIGVTGGTLKIVWDQPEFKIA